jgi:hypothetical protein
MELETQREQIMTRIREAVAENRGRNEDLILESILGKLEKSDSTDYNTPLLLIPYLKNLLDNKLSQVRDVTNLLAAVSALSMCHAAMLDENKQ